ncbi:NAD-dependent epimerase/dehydratase family protein [Robertkochia solimangrovi]|uniref:polysaccharide biosynthesis C-terminal domain-containing protein n=1 Tax=Robertkochia solimangrovi TaxID=2213046 RepID=UPI00117FC8CB|nr:NAD-dependent epimerase/dehydratase family protein [Robertkochia solimangrovi]TRZ45011.1 epimerase [Robertkochia solimangrovi]
MSKIGITGQNGFIGYHLYHFLKYGSDHELVEFERSTFEDPAALQEFVNSCDIIVHLAAMNRHPDPQIIYDTNVALVDQLCQALENAPSSKKVIFSSSAQEEQDNLYGKSKRDARERFKNLADSSAHQCISLTIPNVFGPFCKPNYNSFIATFCHKLTHDEKPVVMKDNEVELIYVQELVEDIINSIEDDTTAAFIHKKVAATAKRYVTEVLQLLEYYTDTYFVAGKMPDLEKDFEKNLFNTFRTYIPSDHYPVSYTCHSDPRGTFVEIMRADGSGQFSFSTTVPGITRGNHFHTRKAERFAVIKGKARIQLRKIGTDEVIDYDLDGETPAFVDMPVWYTHNITNTGSEELLTLFWINEPYNPENADTYFEEVAPATTLNH